jgi:hypothetical protein
MNRAAANRKPLTSRVRDMICGVICDPTGNLSCEEVVALRPMAIPQRKHAAIATVGVFTERA